MAPNPFLGRLLERIPEANITEYQFRHWSFGGKPTDEGVGFAPVPGADPERILTRVMDVDHYVGNMSHVVECRSIPDPAYLPPRTVRFYQRYKITLIGEVHHELVLERMGKMNGFEVACWTLLQSETMALSKKAGMRSQYNDGAWLVAPGLVGLAMSTAPMREDVGLLKWKAMTAGANVAASRVVQDNIQAVARWAARGD